MRVKAKSLRTGKPDVLRDRGMRFPDSIKPEQTRSKEEIKEEKF